MIKTRSKNIVELQPEETSVMNTGLCIPEMFQYQETSLPEDCYHRIAPSMISKFFEVPPVWFRDQILKEEDSKFQGNTATVLGTICHYVYENVTKGNKPTREEINEQLDLYASMNIVPDLDVDEIKIMYPLISNVVMSEYLHEANSKGGLIKVEKKVLAKLAPTIYLGGTVDRIEGIAHYSCSDEALEFLKQQGLT